MVATDAPMPCDPRARSGLARQGCLSILVKNKADAVDDEGAARTRRDGNRELLAAQESTRTPSGWASALKALWEGDAEVGCPVEELMNAVDESRFRPGPRDRQAVPDAGRGHHHYWPRKPWSPDVERGVINVNEEVEIVAFLAHRPPRPPSLV